MQSSPHAAVDVDVDVGGGGGPIIMSRSDEFGKDEEMLRELREISNRYSMFRRRRGGSVPTESESESRQEWNKQHDDKKSRFPPPTPTPTPPADDPSCKNGEGSGKKGEDDGGRRWANDRGAEGCDDDDDDDGGNDFLSRTAENGDLNQYWYSGHSIRVLCDAVREALSMGKTDNNDDEDDDAGDGGGRVAFLSTPSLFFSLTPKERKNCTLFEYDTAKWSSVEQFRHYDYDDPTNVGGEGHRGAYDVICIDPPFVSDSVWRKYAISAKLLARDDGVGDGGVFGGARIIASTVDGNAALMTELFGCERVAFRPRIPRLVYQFSTFANFPSAALAETNPELLEDV